MGGQVLSCRGIEDMLVLEVGKAWLVGIFVNLTRVDWLC
jgi:hypothetical protein